MHLACQILHHSLGMVLQRCLYPSNPINLLPHICLYSYSVDLLQIPAISYTKLCSKAFYQHHPPLLDKHKLVKQKYKTYLILISVLTRLLENLRRLKLLPTPISILKSSPPFQILEFNSSLGSTTRLLHNGKVEDLVGFAVEFDCETIFYVGGVDGDGEGCGSGDSYIGGGGEGCGGGEEAGDEERAEGHG